MTHWEANDYKKEEEYYEKGKAVMADQPDTRTAVDYIMKWAE